jgi:type IV pilus assembly protein PilP
VLSLGLLACGGENVSDLQTYVQDVKTRKKGRVEPLPEVKTYAAYSYDESKLRDPFTPVQRKVSRLRSNNGLQPNFKREREVLEQFPLDTLKMVGSLEQNGERWALIKSQDGTLYRAKRGRYMGQDNGKILQITESKIVLQEIVPDGLGGWVKREATLSVE